MMAGNQLMKDSRARERRIVAAHAHHLLLVRHRVGRIRNENGFAAKEEWANELPFRRHHLHAPGVAGELRDSHQVVIVNELDRFYGEVANQFRSPTRLDFCILASRVSTSPLPAIGAPTTRA